MKTKIKTILPQEIIQWARQNNKKIVVNEEGITFEDAGKPINWSDLISWSIIIIGTLGLIFQLCRI